MTHKVTFEAAKIGLIGKIQPTFDKAVAPDYSNVIAAANLTVEEVITSNSTPIATDNLHRDSIVDITNRTASAKFDSPVPKLGGFYARRYPTSEIYILMIDSTIKTGSGFVIEQVGNVNPVEKLSIATKSDISPSDFVEQLLMYYTSGYTNFNLPGLSCTGELPKDYTCQKIAGDFDNTDGLVFLAKQENSVVADLSLAISTIPALTDARNSVTFTKFEGDGYIGSILPIAPYLEASNMFQEIYTEHGITVDIQNTHKDASDFVCKAQIKTKSAKNKITQCKKWLTEISKLVAMDSDAKTYVDDAIKRCENSERYTGNFINSLEFCKNDLIIFTTDYLANFKSKDLTKMIQDMADDTKLAAGLVRNSLVQTSPTGNPLWKNNTLYLDITGTWESGDYVAFNGFRYTALRRLSAWRVAELIYLSLTNDPRFDANAMIVNTDSTVIEQALVIVPAGIKTSGIGRARVILNNVATGANGISECYLNYYKTPTNQSEIWAGIGTNLIDSVNILNKLNIISYLINNMTTSDLLITGLFSEFKLKAQGYIYEAISDLNTSLKYTLGTSGNWNLVDALKQLVSLVFANTKNAVTFTADSSTPTGSATGIMPADLQLCVDSIIFTNTSESPDMMTLEARRSSTQLKGQQKTKIIKDARALIDLNLEIGKRPMLTFAFEGNLEDTLQKQEVPVNVKKQLYSMGDIVSAKTVRNASLSETCGQTPIIGCVCESNYNNICMVKASMPNFAGYQRAMAMTTCGNLWSYASTPWDMTLEIIQEKADTFNVDSFNVEDSLGKAFNFVYQQNGTAGETIEVHVSNAVLKNFTDGNSQGLLTHVLTLEVTGFSSLILK